MMSPCCDRLNGYAKENFVHWTEWKYQSQRSISVISENEGAGDCRAGKLWGPQDRDAGLFDSSGNAISRQLSIESGIRLTLNRQRRVDVICMWEMAT